MKSRVTKQRRLEAGIGWTYKKDDDAKPSQSAFTRKESNASYEITSSKINDRPDTDISVWLDSTLGEGCTATPDKLSSDEARFTLPAERAWAGS
ncbi:hypothetical protein KM043_011687 [Ampulex compressa]|nr:hypothetical protein KM043_011687 [Ampulex compressa]